MEDTQQDNKDYKCGAHYKCGALPHFNMCSKNIRPRDLSLIKKKHLGSFLAKKI